MTDANDGEKEQTHEEVSVTLVIRLATFLDVVVVVVVPCFGTQGRTLHPKQLQSEDPLQSAHYNSNLIKCMILFALGHLHS